MLPSFRPLKFIVARYLFLKAKSLRFLLQVARRLCDVRVFQLSIVKKTRGKDLDFSKLA